MAKTATAKRQSEATSQAYFRRLAIVFADPIRLKIVSELFYREMSPSQFFASFGGGTLSRVDGHFKRLKESGWLRLVRQQTGGKRRGAVENFYRAPKLAIFDNDSWAELPRPLRKEFSWRTFEQFAEQVKIALEAGTFDSREERHFSWSALVLDWEGRVRVIEMVDELFAALNEEQADARVRLDHSGERPMHATVGLAAFDSPRGERNRSGLILPATEPGPTLNEEFRVRLSRVFRSSMNLKIVAELSLREMSASQFAAEYEMGDLSEVSRRFRGLAEQGWLRKVKTERGGKRRGGTETFYRAVGPAIFDTRSWAQVPEEVRETVDWRVFEQLTEQVREAMEAETFDAHTDRHHTWSPFVLDEFGWRQVIRLIDKTFKRMFQEQALAKRRLAQSGAEPVIATVYLAAFESPAP